MSSKVILYTSLILLCWVPAAAQRRVGTEPARRDEQPPLRQQTAQGAGKQIPPDSADIAITATVTARELLFEVVPNPTVEFPGKPQRDTLWDAVRENLPRPVSPGVTYRNIGIRLTIVSRFSDIERIVAEALGEIPVTDSTPPPVEGAPQPPQQQNPQPPVSTSQPNGGSPR